MIHKAFNITVAISLLLAVSVARTGAEDDMAGEYLVKAAFLYNFAKFVEWPEEAFYDDRSPLTLCILGEDPFGLGPPWIPSGERPSKGENW